MTATYRISQLAERVGVPATTLRFYEKEGLIVTERSPAGYRRYGEADVERIRFISAAKQLGLPLGRIRDLLRVWDGGRCRDIRDELRPMIRQQIADADGRVADLTAYRDKLGAALRHLRRLPAEDGPCDTACEFLHVRRSGRPTARRSAPRRGPAAPAEPHAVEAPVACRLDAAGYRDRAGDWRRLLADTDRTRSPDGGMRVRMPADRAAALAALAVAEQECCPFLTFRITLAATHVDMEVHAPASAAPLVAALLAEPDRAAASC